MNSRHIAKSVLLQDLNIQMLNLMEIQKIPDCKTVVILVGIARQVVSILKDNNTPSFQKGGKF